jgi:hypothetical protein
MKKASESFRMGFILMGFEIKDRKTDGTVTGLAH